MQNVLEGYNGTIFAYGQTGTGKTFTMEGDRSVPELKGIIPNSFAHIFGSIAKAEDNVKFLVRVSYLEIYNEDVRDLLGKDQNAKYAALFHTYRVVQLNFTPEIEVFYMLFEGSLSILGMTSNKQHMEYLNLQCKIQLDHPVLYVTHRRSFNFFDRLEVKERPDVGVYVKDLSAFVVNNADDMDKVMTMGNKHRMVGSTKMNERSSRSHAIFTITVECSERGGDGQQHLRAGKLHLVDLAGSERQVDIWLK